MGRTIRLRSAMSLAALPIEIIERICDYIPRFHMFGDVGKLRDLALTCRICYKIVLPHLYHNIQVQGDRLYHLVRTMIHKPDLANMVKQLAIASLRKESESGKACTLLRRPGILPEGCLKFIRSGGIRVNNIWLAEILLLRTKNVEDLSIEFSDLPNRMLLFEQFRWVSAGNSYLENLLPKLRSLSLCTWCMSYNSPPILLHSSHLLNRVKPAKLHFELWYQLRCRGSSLQPLPSVEELQITTPQMGGLDLRNLFELCPNIKKFSYHGNLSTIRIDESFHDTNFGAYWENASSGTLPFRGVISKLKPLEKQLTSLTLVYDSGGADDGIYAEDTVEDLKHFSSLKTLFLAADCLTEMRGDLVVNLMALDSTTFLHKFPNTLESISLFRAGDKHIEELKSLAGRKQVEFPDLKRLTLEWWLGDFEEDIETLDEELRNVGVELKLDRKG